jgi:aquaporin Z
MFGIVIVVHILYSGGSKLCFNSFFFVMKKLLVEALGTFFLVLVIALTGDPIAIGVVLMVMVYMGGHISGAHYNPAVTLGVWMRGDISTKKARKYVVAQIV